MKVILDAISKDLGFSIFSLLISILTIPVIIVKVGAEAYGVWIAVSAACIYLHILNFDFDQYFINHSSQLGPSFSKNLIILFGLKCLFAPLFFVMGFLMSIFAGDLIDYTGISLLELRTSFMAHSLVLALGLFSQLFNSYLFSLKKMNIHMATPNILAISSSLATIIFLVGGVGYYSLVFGMMFGSFLSFLISGYAAISNGFFREFRSSVRITRSDLNPFFHFAFGIHIYKNLSALRLSNLTLVINHQLGPEVNAIVAVMMRLGNLALQFTFRLLIPFYPYLCDYYKTSKRKLVALFKIQILMMLLIGVAVFLFLIVINKEFIAIWVGVEFFGGNDINAVLALLVSVLICFSNVSYFVFMIEKFTAPAFIVFCEVFIFLLIGLTSELGASLFELLILFVVLVWCSLGAQLVFVIRHLKIDIYECIAFVRRVIRFRIILFLFVLVGAVLFFLGEKDFIWTLIFLFTGAIYILFTLKKNGIRQVLKEALRA